MLKDIIKNTLLLLSENELADKIDLINTKSTISTELTSLSDFEKKDVNLIIYLSKIVLDSITRSYIKNSVCENVTSDDNGKIYYSSLTYQIIGINDVRDGQGNLIVFDEHFDHVSIPYKNYRVTISYAFENFSLDSIFDDYKKPIEITDYILSLGVAAEFARIKLLSNESFNLDSKFKEELENAKSNRKPKHIAPYKRWNWWEIKIN